jgi:hypothetical protein
VVDGIGNLGIKDYEDLIKALNHHATRGTINYLVKIHQGNREKFKGLEKNLKTAEVKRAGLQTVSYKEFVYDGTRKFLLGQCLRLHAGIAPHI